MLFMVKFPDKCEWLNSFKPNIREGLVWYMDSSKSNEGIDAWVYRWGSRRRCSFSLGSTPYSRLKYMPLRHV
jgi:hypothetical protein